MLLPSGQDFLQPIIEAMKENRVLNMTYDFVQELLWNGEDVEVLEPLWLRKEIAGKIKRMWKKYKED